MIWLGIVAGFAASTAGVLFLFRDRPLSDQERADGEEEANMVRWLVYKNPGIIR